VSDEATEALSKAAELAKSAAAQLVAATQQDRSDKQYYELQGIVSGINASCPEVKKWSVTSASIIALVGQLGIGRLAWVMAIVALLALAFWTTEAIWRKTQAAFILHIRTLEANDSTNVLQISQQWSRNFLGNENTEQKAMFWRRFWAWETMFPHLLIVLLSALPAILLIAGWLDVAQDGTEERFRIILDGPLEFRTMP